MRFVVALDGSEQALRGARLVASLPLRADDEVLLASILERPVFIGAWEAQIPVRDRRGRHTAIAGRPR